MAEHLSKKALLVGINNFIHLAGSNLRGCVDDALKHAWMLEKYYGFPKSAIRILLNEQATYEAVADGHKWLCGDVQSGDERVGHKSSHGTNVVDVNGDEPSGLDSAFCCADCYFDEKGVIHNAYLDDTLHEQYKNIPAGARVALSIDACHMGDMTREIGQSVRSMPLTPEAAALLYKAQSRGLVPAGIGSDTLPIQYLPGCGLRQTSADAFIDGCYCGAFSYYLRKVLIASPYLPLPEVARQVNALLAVNGYTQRTAPEGMYRHESYLWRKAA